MKKCTNCDWEGEKNTRPYNICPICGDYTVSDSEPVQSIKKEESINLDLNNDGKIDAKDASIASRVMNAVKNKKKSSKKKKR